MKSLVAAALLAAFSSQAVWSAERTPLTYDELRKRVLIYDLHVCPDALASPDVFCGLALAAFKLNVFAFSREGDHRLVAAASYDLGRLDDMRLDTGN